MFWVLGAGFSRAVSDRFPLTDELGDLVRDHLRILQSSRWLPEGPFENGSFEAWLSSLAAEQPDLDEGDNKERQALFARSIELTWSLMRAREDEVGARARPDWLSRLRGCAHVGGLTLISLNYDTVVEAALSGAGIYDRAAKGLVNPTTRSTIPDGTELTIIDHHAEVSGEIVRSHVLTASTGFAGLNPEHPG